MACTYASLILYDDGQDITGDKLNSLIGSANVKVESYWPKMFAKAVAGQDISSFFNFGGSASSSAPTAVAATKEEPKADKGKKEDKKKKEEPKVEEEEEDVGMGGLFD